MAQPGLPGSQFPSEDDLVRRLKDLQRDVQQFTAANVLATAGISVIADGLIVNGLMEFKRADGTRGVSVDPSNGTFVAYDFSGEGPVARFGALEETAPPGFYGVEVLVGTTWVQLGNQTTTWDSVSGKPATFAPTLPIAGTGITGTVPDATTSTTAAQADGNTTSAFNRDIAGIPGTYKAVWMHSTNVFGYNTSDERYKKNIRDLSLTPAQLLALRAVLYDRKATNADDYTPAVHGDELGLIAAEVAAAIPELALKFDGEIDSVFYERLPVVLLPFVQAHERAITELVAENAQQAADIAALKQAVRDLGGNI